MFPRDSPREIQDAIIDQLHTDTKSLSVCSLVSKQWLARSRHWALDRRQAKLISNDMPDSFYDKRDARRFIELLHAPHSTLPSLIQCLVLYGPDLGHEASDVTGPQRCYDLLGALISEHLPLLCNLRTITIVAITWRCLRPESKALIGSLPQVTSVTWQSMAVDRLHDLFEFCSTNFPSLQALKIRQIKVAKPESQDARLPSTTSHSFPRLRLLDVVADTVLHPLLSVPSMYIQPENIETVCLGGVSIHHIPLVRRFIEAAGPGLRHVALGIRKDCALILPHISYDQSLDLHITASTASSISFHANPNLRSLEISEFALHPVMPCDSSWLEAIITTITSHSFKDLTLWFNATHTARLEGFDFQSLQRKILQRLDPLALPIVHAKFVQTGAWKDTDNDGLVAAVERQLPELHKRRLLVVYPKGWPLSEALDGWWPYVW